MPVPRFGVARNRAIGVQTGASEVYVRVSTGAPLRYAQVAGTSIMPLPWAYTGAWGIGLAAVYSARRSAAGVMPWSVAFAADSSSAAAPVACGAAIEVPLNIEYPGGSG